MKRAWSTFWVIAGGSMLIAGIWLPWFDVNFTWFKLNVGWFGLVYGLMGLYYNYKLSQTLQLTPREMHDYGDTLTRVAPKMVDRLRHGAKPKAVAIEIQETEGVPLIVTLKFMLALSHQAPDLLVREASAPPQDTSSKRVSKT